jgi:hypothetical protein
MALACIMLKNFFAAASRYVGRMHGTKIGVDKALVL